MRRAAARVRSACVRRRWAYGPSIAGKSSSGATRRLTTPRAEKDLVSILSGTEHGYTLGTPIGLLVPNEDQRPGDYKEMSNIPRYDGWSVEPS